MAISYPMISGVVEGATDEVVLRALIAAAGLETSVVYGKMGKDQLKKNLVAYNQAAQYNPWGVPPPPL
jgi:hypothetical protein